MLTVEYLNDEYESVVDYAYPNIQATFNYHGATIVFCPESLGKSNNWTQLLAAIQNNTPYNLESCGTNSNYGLHHDNGFLTLSIGAYGSGTVGSLDITIPLSENVTQTLVELEKLAKCIEARVAYQ